MAAFTASSVLLVFLFCLGSAAPDLLHTNSLADSAPQEELPADLHPISKIMGEECKEGGWSGRCLKLGLLRLLGKSGVENYKLSEGLSLSVTPPPMPPLARLHDAASLDRLLASSLALYLGSLSLNVRILDSEAPLNLAKAYYTGASTGRRRGGGKYGGALAAMGMMSAGMMVSTGLAALMAIAGKALVASMLAFMLASIAALKGDGEEKKTTYEVVAKPVVSHQHVQTSEVVHGGHAHAHARRRGLPDLPPVHPYSAHLPKH